MARPVASDASPAWLADRWPPTWSVTMPDAIEPVTLVANQGWDPRILICRCAPVVDVFVVVSQRFVVIIDTLLNPATASDLLAIARPHLTADRALLVINTHAHYDHAWGNQLFAGPEAVVPAPIIGTRRCAALLQSDHARAELAQRQAHDPDRYGAVRLVAPTVLFDDHLTIDGGDLTLELIATPGHAADHVAIFIPEIKTLLAGDAAEHPFPFCEDAANLPVLRASLARLAALAPTTVLACHAPATIDPALLGRNRAYFDRLEEACRAARRRGVSLHPTDDAELEALVGFPFAEAIPAGTVVAQPAFYRPGHQAHIRMMLAWLTTQAEQG